MNAEIVAKGVNVFHRPGISPTAIEQKHRFGRKSTY
jgi:hypothetical protein